MDNMKAVRVCIYSAVVFLILPVIWSPGHAQQVERIHRMFDRGVEAYNNRKYEIALSHFQQVQAQSGFNPMATANHLMLVKSYHQLGLERQGIELGKEFLKAYPSSTYRDDIYFTMAEAHLGLTEYENSVQYYAQAMLSTSDNALAHTALDYLLKITDTYLTIDEVQALVDGTLDSRKVQIYRLALLQEYIQNGEMSLASTTSMEIENQELMPILRPVFRATRKAISLDMDKKITIAVIVPLSGPSASVGKNILEGVRFALSRAEDLPQVSIIPMDNKAAGLRSVEQFSRAARHHRVVATIGPVYSENVISCAAMAGMQNLPLISPTATANGLAALNHYIFQLNPDFETRGKATAQYALDSLRLQTFAVVSPVTEQGKSLTDAFTAEVEERGGEVISQVWYSRDDEDLGDQFEHLRKVGFKIRADRQGPVDTSKIVSDSLRATLPDSEFVALFHKRMEERAEEIDSAAIELQAFDGMYFPVNHGDIDYIAPNIGFYNFDTELLGNVEWNDPEKLKQWSSYIDSMYIFSDYYFSEETFEGRSFVSEFRKEMNVTPTSLHLYGFEAMSLILRQVRNGVKTRRSLAEAFRSIHQVDGIARNYTLDGARQRVNQTLQVLQYTRQGLQRIDTLTVGPRRIHPMEMYFAE